MLLEVTEAEANELKQAVEHELDEARGELDLAQTEAGRADLASLIERLAELHRRLERLVAGIDAYA